MASDQTLRAIITVLDRTAEPVHAINARFQAMSLPLREIGSRISEFAEETGLKAIAEHARGAWEHVSQLGERLRDIAGPLAALGAAGSIAGLAEITKSAAEFAEKLNIGSRMTGIASEQLAGWHYAAGLVNIDVERLDRGFTFLNRNIADAAGGKAKDVQTILSHMGFHNTPGHLVSTADALKAVAAEAQHLVNSGQVELATSMMAKLFGARSGAQLLPLFEQGPEALAKTLQEAQEAGISLTSAQTAGGVAFMEQYKAMRASVEGLKIAIGSELFPVLTPIIEHAREWLNVNREWIATKVGEVVQDHSATRCAGLDWAGIGEDIKSIASAARWVVQEVGGIGPAAAIVAAISVAPAILAFTELGGSVAVAASKLLLFPAASFVATLATLACRRLASVRDVFVALDIAMDANPIGAIVLGATLLAGAAYEIYQHWDGLVEFFKTLWADIAGIFDAGWHKIELDRECPARRGKLDRDASGPRRPAALAWHAGAAALPARCGSRCWRWRAGMGVRTTCDGAFRERTARHVRQVGEPGQCA